MGFLKGCWQNLKDGSTEIPTRVRMKSPKRSVWHYCWGFLIDSWKYSVEITEGPLVKFLILSEFPTEMQRNFKRGSDEISKSMVLKSLLKFWIQTLQEIVSKPLDGFKRNSWRTLFSWKLWWVVDEILGKYFVIIYVGFFRKLFDEIPSGFRTKYLKKFIRN